MKNTICRELDYSVRFIFPSDIVERRLEDGRTLVIAPAIPNWITLISTEETVVYKCLSNDMSIQETLEQLGETYTEALKNVLIELLHNDFCDSEVGVKESGSKCNLTAYLTNRCNLKCYHCYRYSNKHGKELSTEQWQRILSEYSSLDDCGGYVTYSGGEVSLRSDCLSIFKHAFKHGLRNVCLTNGTLWKLEDYKRMVPYLHEVQISLDGINADMNNSVRGDGTFEVILNSLNNIAHCKRVSNPRLRIALAMTFMPESLDKAKAGILPFVEKIKDEVGEDIIFRIATHLKEGRCVGKLNKEADEKYKTASSEIKSFIYNDPFWEARLFSTCFSPFLRVVNCGFGQNISIQPDGKVPACSESQDELVGNAETDSIITIRERLQEIFRRTSLNNMKECDECDIRYMCGGGCRIDNLSFGNSYLTPSCCRVDPSFKKTVYRVMADRRYWSWTK